MATAIGYFREFMNDHFDQLRKLQAENTILREQILKLTVCVCGTNNCACITFLSLSKEENKELKKIISLGKSRFAPG